MADINRLELAAQLPRSRDPDVVADPCLALPGTHQSHPKRVSLQRKEVLSLRAQPSAPGSAIISAIDVYVSKNMERERPQQ